MEAMRVPWSDLPKELVENISKFLNSHIDILRIRAICNSWRSAIPLNLKKFPSLPLIKLPIPDMIHGYHEESKFYLIESTVYLFQLPHPPHTGWLVKIVKTLDGKLKILNPLTKRVIQDSLDNMPKKLNLLDFRVSQVSKSYHVQWVLKFNDLGYNVGHFFRKILLIWSDQTNHFSLMATSIRDQLFCLKSGDEKWTTLKHASSKIVDIIVYKGNFYAVDIYGKTIKYDPSSFNEINVASTIKMLSSSLFNGWGSKKRLVESGGELFLVDMFLDGDVKRELHGYGPLWDNPMEINVYQLVEEQHEWIAVHTLGDRIFFAGDDCCFSVSSSDFGDQCRGNCIYYENGDLIVDILGELLPKYYDADFEDDCVCGGDFSYPIPVDGGVNFSSDDDDDDDPILVDGDVKLSSNDDDDDDDAPILVDGGVKVSSNCDDDNDDEDDDNDDDSPILVDGGVKLSNNDGNIDKNVLGRKSSGGLSEELKLRYKGLHGQHTGIITLQDGKLGSLLSFLEYADIFWPPPSWVFTDDQADSSYAHN